MIAIRTIRESIVTHSTNMGQALQRLKAQVDWLKTGTVEQNVPMLTVVDMEFMHERLQSIAQLHEDIRNAASPVHLNPEFNGKGDEITRCTGCGNWSPEWHSTPKHQPDCQYLTKEAARTRLSQLVKSAQESPIEA